MGLSWRLGKGCMFVGFFLLLGIIIFNGSGRRVHYATNISGAMTLQAVHFEAKYDDEDEKLEVRPVNNMNEVALYGPTSPVSFVGQMTAYGPDCVGCSGVVACPPRPNVSNNTYFEDPTYGTVNILAADGRIPCGSIIKISNVTFTNEEIYGIVLDRGGVIKGNIIDFLVKSEAASYSIGRQKNVLFEVIRWGW